MDNQRKSAALHAVGSNFHDLAYLLNDRPGAGKKYERDYPYQMVTYSRTPSPAWIRAPFLTLGEVKEALEQLPHLWSGSNHLEESGTKRPRINPAYTGLRIYDESYLSELQQDWNEEKQSYEDTEFTRRQVLFGTRYDDYAVCFTGIPSLARQKGEDKGEWTSRVKEQRSAREAEHRDYCDFIWKIEKEQDQIRVDLGLATAAV